MPSSAPAPTPSGFSTPAASAPAPSAPPPPELGVGPLLDRFDDVRRIAVLRGGGLGDVLFAMPAVTALAAAYPGATVTLLGTPLHAALFDGRESPVDEVAVLPFRAGIRDGVEDPAATSAFLESMRGRGFDLAVQLHGGGRNSNPFVAELGARHTVGTATPDAPPLERTMPYVYYQHEVLRALEVVGLAGASPVHLEPRLEVSEADRARAASHRRTEWLVVLHPGATDVRRRWPAERFAEVARRLAADGVQVLVVGDGSDAASADSIVAAVDSPLVSSLAGGLSIGELAALSAVSDVFLGNDSGPRHLAQAVGAQTVGVFWVGNLINAGPLGRAWHRAQVSWTTHCPVCGRDATQVGWTAERCEHELSFISDVAVDPVFDDVVSLLAEPKERWQEGFRSPGRGALITNCQLST